MVSSKLIKRDKYFLSLFSFGSEPKKLNKIFLQIASLLLPLLIWTFVCQLKLVSEMFLPSPLAVFYSLLDMAESGILFEDIFASTGRVFAGFVIATITKFHEVAILILKVSIIIGNEYLAITLINKSFVLPPKVSVVSMSSLGTNFTESITIRTLK